MKFNLKVTDRVKAGKNPRKMIQLAIKTMHGDADSYETVTVRFDPTDSKKIDLLNSILTVINIFFSLDWNTRINFLSRTANRMKILHDAGMTDNEEIDRVMDQIFIYDLTNESSLAMPESFQLTYFDEHGDEYHMVAISENEEEK